MPFKWPKFSIDSNRAVYFMVGGSFQTSKYKMMLLFIEHVTIFACCRRINFKATNTLISAWHHYTVYLLCTLHTRLRQWTMGFAAYTRIQRLDSSDRDLTIVFVASTDTFFDGWTTFEWQFSNLTGHNLRGKFFQLWISYVIFRNQPSCDSHGGLTSFLSLF